MSSEGMSQLHKRNLHRGRYDFPELVKELPELEKYVIVNPHGDKTINFSDAEAVLLLNKALLKSYYNVQNWIIPKGYLCPPIPGRADYIHYTADLLGEMNNSEIPKGKRVKVLDIGTGANCIYPIIGSQSYGWKFIATEIDPLSIKTARLIVQSNNALSKHIKIRQQKQKQFILRNIIEEGERIDITICNPPFHSSKKDAIEGNLRKWKNLNQKSDSTSLNLNFGGSENELWCPGGELAFIKKMMRESRDYSKQVCWFTSLVSKKENVFLLKESAMKLGAKDIRVISMAQGQKISRLITWSFLNESEQNQWAEKYWN